MEEVSSAWFSENAAMLSMRKRHGEEMEGGYRGGDGIHNGGCRIVVTLAERKHVIKVHHWTMAQYQLKE